MDTLTEWEALVRIGLALLAGSALGLEREWRQKSAGLRTHALVCEGSALFMVGSIMLGDQVRADGGIGYDPSRIGSTIVQGIGFLAGGVILTSGRRVLGLTTAAGLWVTAAIGLLIGAGLYVAAFGGLAGALLALVAYRWLERRFPVAAPDVPLKRPHLAGHAHRQRPPHRRRPSAAAPDASGRRSMTAPPDRVGPGAARGE